MHVGPLVDPHSAASSRRDGAGRPAATLLQPNHVWEPPAAAGGGAVTGWTICAPQEQASQTRASSLPPSRSPHLGCSATKATKARTAVSPYSPKGQLLGGSQAGYEDWHHLDTGCLFSSLPMSSDQYCAACGHDSWAPRRPFDPPPPPRSSGRLVPERGGLSRGRPHLPWAKAGRLGSHPVLGVSSRHVPAPLAW